MPETKPTYDQLAQAYCDLHLAAQTVSDHFRSTPGGDAFEWRGSMNMVETMRQAIELHERDDDFFSLIYGDVDGE